MKNKNTHIVYVNATFQAIFFSLMAYGPGAFFYIPAYLFCYYILNYDIVSWISADYISLSNPKVTYSILIFLTFSNIVMVSNYLSQLYKLAKKSTKIGQSMFQELKITFLPSFKLAAVSYILWIAFITIFNIYLAESFLAFLFLWILNCFVCCIYYNKKAFDKFNTTEIHGLFR